MLSFDVPTNLGPPGSVIYLPGQIVAWSGLSYSLFQPLAGWPISSGVDGLSCQGNPGQVPTTLKVNKSILALADLQLNWTTSCSQGRPS